MRAAQLSAEAKQLEQQLTGELLSGVSQRIESAKSEYEQRIKFIDQYNEALVRKGELSLTAMRLKPRD